MTRDMDLVRTILLVVEKEGQASGWLEFTPEDTPGYTEDQVVYHMRLLRDAGFLESVDRETFDGDKYFPKRLTWEGHEFLEAARNETVWAKAKTVVGEKGGSIPFEILKELLIGLAREYFLGS